MDPVHELLRFDQLGEMHCLDDAFTFTFKALLRHLCNKGEPLLVAPHGQGTILSTSRRLESLSLVAGNLNVWKKRGAHLGSTSR